MKLIVNETAMASRREQATDARGLPASYAAAVKALAGPCAHCDQRAIAADRRGVGLCDIHRRQRTTDIEARERIRRAIDMARRA